MAYNRMFEVRDVLYWQTPGAYLHTTNQLRGSNSHLHPNNDVNTNTLGRLRFGPGCSTNFHKKEGQSTSRAKRQIDHQQFA
jgi:hypothetical protein